MPGDAEGDQQQQHPQPPPVVFAGVALDPRFAASAEIVDRAAIGKIGLARIAENQRRLEQPTAVLLDPEKKVNIRLDAGFGSNGESAFYLTFGEAF
jgi:hypothetical protein